MAITDSEKRQVLSQYGLSLMPFHGESFEAYRERASAARVALPGAADDYYALLVKLESANGAQVAQSSGVGTKTTVRSGTHTISLQRLPSGKLFYQHLGANDVLWDDGYYDETDQVIREAVDKYGVAIPGAGTSTPAPAATQAVAASSTPKTVETKAEVVAPVQATAPTTNKILSGTIAGGKVGTAASFVPREDDVIDSIDDLERAAQFNLVSFLLAITSRLTYEIKLVNRLVLRDGTVKEAGAVRVISGYSSTGAAKYRTLINKFAVMNIYAISDTGTRSKIAVVNLGPTDAAKLNPSATQVTNLSAKVQKDVQITEVGNVIEVKGASASTTQSKQTTTTKPATSSASTAPSQTAASPVQPAAVVKPGADAGNLFDWYAAQGQTLPTLAFRAQLYEKFKLGSAVLYVGSAEQNTKLLNALKAG